MSLGIVGKVRRNIRLLREELSGESLKSSRPERGKLSATEFLTLLKKKCEEEYHPESCHMMMLYSAAIRRKIIRPDEDYMKAWEKILIWTHEAVIP